MEEAFRKQCDVLLPLLDLLCVSIYKIHDMSMGNHLEASIATKEATKMVTTISQFVGLLNKLPRSRPSETPINLLKAHKGLEISSVSARKQILLIIGHTKKNILQPDSSLDRLLVCVKDALDSFTSLYRHAWCLQNNKNNAVAWHSDTRRLWLRLRALLELSAELMENEKNLMILDSTVQGISEHIRLMQDCDSYLDTFPVPIQALLMEISSNLSSIHSQAKPFQQMKEIISDDVEPIVGLLHESLQTTNLLESDISELKTEDNEKSEKEGICASLDEASVSVPDVSDKEQRCDDIETTQASDIQNEAEEKESVPETEKKKRILVKPRIESFGRQRSQGIAVPPNPQLLRTISQTFTGVHEGGNSHPRTNTDFAITTDVKQRKNTFAVSSPRPTGDRGSIFGVQRVSHEETKKKQEKQKQKAQGIISLLKQSFDTFENVWENYSDKNKESFLLLLADKVQESSYPPDFLYMPESVTKSQELEHVIRLRCAADMTKIVSSEKFFIAAEKPMAEHCLHLIVNSNLVVIDPQQSEYQEVLLRSAADVILMMKEIVKKLPTISEKVGEFREDLKEMLQEQSNNMPQLYVADEYIVKAAKGHGNKLISYQMRINIWNGCNSLRILVAVLLGLLQTCNDPSQLNCTVFYQIFTCIRSIVRVIGTLLGQVATTKEIMTKVYSNASPNTRADTTTPKEVNIWKECTAEGKFIWEVESRASSDIQTGSLNLLVQSLTSDINLNQTFLKTFITTYRSFTTPWQLLSKLIERYNVPLDVFQDEKRASQIKLRVAVVVKYWLDTQFHDFDEDLIQSLQQFCGTMFDDGLTDMAKRLQEHITSKETERNQRQESMISIPPTDLMCFTSLSTISDMFLNISVEELARQLTLADFKIYRSIQAQELLNTAWNSDKLKHQSPHVTLLLGRLNDISNFLCSLILWQETKALRAFVISKFIRLGTHLHKLNNFHTLMGVVVALNRSSISRLRHSFAACDAKLLNQFKSLESLMDPSGAFKNYRKAIQQTKLPALPYLGVSLTDLTFIEDGNPDNLDDSHTGKQVINFTKRNMVYELIQKLLDYQNTPYNFPAFEPVQTLLTEFLFDTEKYQFSLSLLREPRNADPKSII